MSFSVFLLEHVTAGLLGSLRCHCKTFLSCTCRAGSCSGVQWCTEAGGEHGRLPACSSVMPALLGRGTGRKDLIEERLFFVVFGFFFNSSKYTDVLRAKVKIQAISVTKWVLVSLCMRVNRVFLLQSPSIQLRLEAWHPWKTCITSCPSASFFPKNSSKVRAHALGTSHEEAQVLSALKTGLWFCETIPLDTQFTRIWSLHPSLSVSGWPWWTASSASVPATAWHPGLSSLRYTSSKLLPPQVPLAVLEECCFRRCRRMVQGYGYCLHNCFVHKYSNKTMILPQHVLSLRKWMLSSCCQCQAPMTLAEHVWL